MKHRARVVAAVGIVLGIAWGSEASADDTVQLMEIRGIELVVPAGWKEVKKKGFSQIAPTQHKGRVVQVFSLDRMPAATTDALARTLGDPRFTVVSVKSEQRQGFTTLVGTARLDADGKPADVDVAILPLARGAAMILAFIAADKDPVLRDANVKILLSARVAGPRVSVTVVPTRIPGGAGAPEPFVALIRRAGKKIDESWRLPGPLAIRIEDCGTANAFYSPADHSIHVCHEMFGHLEELFTKVGYAKGKIPEMVRDTMLFVFLHELGHAFVGELKLPITGKGEDAADELAAIILLAGGAGKTTAYHAAMWFKANAVERPTNTFWDNHSFNDQRFVSIVCLLYGADPKQYRSLMEQYDATQKRLKRCPVEYEARLNAWETLLAPHERPDKSR